MGTANFMFNRRLDVVSGLSISQFDIDTYNEGMDTEDHLQPDDYERISDIIGIETDDFIDNFKYGADKSRCTRRVGGLNVEIASQSVNDGRHSHKYSNRNYGGTTLAEINTETAFFGRTIRMEMTVILRHGYYDGVNIDQKITLGTDFSYYSLEDYGVGDADGVTDWLIDEYANCHIASKAKLKYCRKGIAKCLAALEKALWERYEEMVAPYCEQYRVVARFGNGETWYERSA